jgi:hypothetical protein
MNSADCIFCFAMFMSAASTRFVGTFIFPVSTKWLSSALGPSKTRTRPSKVPSMPRLLEIVELDPLYLYPIITLAAFRFSAAQSTPRP